LFDALDALVDGVAVQAQALGGLEPVAVFHEQGVEGMHQAWAACAQGRSAGRGCG
jgi:hypothetical protein